MAEKGNIDLVIVTPERAVIRDSVDELQIPGTEGYFGVLPGHAPLFSEMKVGEVGYRQGNQWHYLSVAWGFVEVLPDKVRMLAEAAERPQEIDIERATRAKDRAEKRIASGGDDLDYNRAMVALERALIRLQVSQKTRI
jgi:F-type H+-transporting ATPase subunit epsilon